MALLYKKLKKKKKLNKMRRQARYSGMVVKYRNKSGQLKVSDAKFLL